jgi:hypothetical protein
VGSLCHYFAGIGNFYELLAVFYEHGHNGFYNQFLLGYKNNRKFIMRMFIKYENSLISD